MRLGGSLFAPWDTPEGWVKALRDKGYGAALCPVKADAPLSDIRAYERAAASADIVIAEVGVWNNPIHPDAREKEKAIAHSQGQLALADEIGAACCVNIAGSKDPAVWDGPHPGNFSPETFEEIVETVRAIIDAVKPRRTFYTLEAMPWVPPDTVGSYLDLIRAVGRDRFAVHIDMVNVIRTPREHYRSGDLIREWFRRLRPYIKSCHAKDTVLTPRYTSHTGEAAPGLGALDYVTLLREAEAISPDMPLIIEHLKTEPEYDAAAAYIRQRAREAGVPVKW